MRRRRKALRGMGPGDVLLATAADAVEREAVPGNFDPGTAVWFRELLTDRYLAVSTPRVENEVIAQKEPTLAESTVGRMVGMAVGTVVELGASPMQAAEIATEGVWTALRFAEYSAMIGRDEQTE